MPATTSPVAVSPADRAEHLYWIDWLRFLAAAAVVVNHTREFNWSPWPDAAGHGAHALAMNAFFSLTQLGPEAVVVFFVLSGWLVGGKALERARRGTFDLADYTADRVSRLYVPLVPALLLTAAVVRGFDLPFAPGQYLACLAGLQSAYVETPYMNIPLWTLGYEMGFYALAGCAAGCGRGGSTGRRLAAGAGAALALGLLLHRREGSYLLCWLLGAAGYTARGRLPRGRVGSLLAAGVAVVAGTLIRQIDSGVLPAVPPSFATWMPTPVGARLLLAAGTVLAVAALARWRPATRAGRRIERLGTPLAAFSYTLYLTHCPTLWFLALPTARMPPALDGPSLGRAAGWIAACVAVALVMYVLFEARTLSVRRWLRGRLGGTGPQPVSARIKPLGGSPLAVTP